MWHRQQRFEPWHYWTAFQMTKKEAWMSNCQKSTNPGRRNHNVSWFIKFWKLTTLSISVWSYWSLFQNIRNHDLILNSLNHDDNLKNVTVGYFGWMKEQLNGTRHCHCVYNEVTHVGVAELLLLPLLLSWNGLVLAGISFSSTFSFSFPPGEDFFAGALEKKALEIIFC